MCTYYFLTRRFPALCTGFIKVFPFTHPHCVYLSSFSSFPRRISHNFIGSVWPNRNWDFEASSSIFQTEGRGCWLQSGLIERLNKPHNRNYVITPTPLWIHSTNDFFPIRQLHSLTPASPIEVGFCGQKLLDLCVSGHRADAFYPIFLFPPPLPPFYDAMCMQNYSLVSELFFLLSHSLSLQPPWRSPSPPNPPALVPGNHYNFQLTSAAGTNHVRIFGTQWIPFQLEDWNITPSPPFPSHSQPLTPTPPTHGSLGN